MQIIEGIHKVVYLVSFDMVLLSGHCMAVVFSGEKFDYISLGFSSFPSPFEGFTTSVHYVIPGEFDTFA